MASFNYENVVVFDLEALCWETRAEADLNNKEIIEIGACNLNVLTGEITNNKSYLIKPTISNVSPFCEQLTGISQSMLDADGMRFERAVKLFKQDFNLTNATVATYGLYDTRKMIEECEARGFEINFSEQFINVSLLSSLRLKAGGKLGLDKALEAFSISFEQEGLTQHRALSDAVMTAKLLYKLLGN